MLTAIEIIVVFFLLSSSCQCPLLCNHWILLVNMGINVETSAWISIEFNVFVVLSAQGPDFAIDSRPFLTRPQSYKVIKFTSSPTFTRFYSLSSSRSK